MPDQFHTSPTSFPLSLLAPSAFERQSWSRHSLPGTWKECRGSSDSSLSWCSSLAWSDSTRSCGTRVSFRRAGSALYSPKCPSTCRIDTRSARSNTRQRKGRLEIRRIGLHEGGLYVCQAVGHSNDKGGEEIAQVEVMKLHTTHKYSHVRNLIFWIEVALFSEKLSLPPGEFVLSEMQKLLNNIWELLYNDTYILNLEKTWMI